jgi:bifunctional DNA-binding transcriptional regulator/antitoxin component of YhaV-PrlF toxin-antitoxin module
MAIRVDSKGRVVLPLAAREAMGIEADDELIAVVGRGRVTLMTKDEARRELREAFANGPNPVDELLAERRAEALADLEEFERWQATKNR